MKIGCAVSYYSIIAQAYTFSTWVNIEEDLSLRGVHGNLSIGKLRVHLTSIGRFPQAFKLLDYELKFTQEEHRIVRFRGFLEECQKNLLSSKPAVLFYLIARLEVVAMLLHIDELDLSQQELENIDTLAANHSWILASDLPYRVRRNYQAQIFALRSFQKIPLLFAAALESREQGDYMFEYQASIPIPIALSKVEVLERDEEWYLYYAQYQKLLFARQLDMDGNALAIEACTNLTKFFQLRAMADYETATKLLVSLKNFEDKYPDFDIPIFRRILYTQAVEVAIAFGSLQQATDFDDKRIAAGAEERVTTVNTLLQYRSSDVDNWSRGLFVVVLSWINLSLRSRELSLTEAKDILDIQIAEGEQDVRIANTVAQLPKHSPSTLAKEFFGYPDPVPSDIWEKRVLKYNDWLWDRPACIPRHQRHTVISDILQVRRSLVDTYLEIRRQNAPRLLKIGAPITELENFHFEWQQTKFKDLSFAFDLRKSLDPGALGVSKFDLFSTEWLLRSFAVRLAKSYKAYQLKVVTDDMLREHQEWFENAYKSYAFVLGPRILYALAIIVQAIGFRYILFGSVSPDAALQVLERIEGNYIQERQAKSILGGGEDILARSKIWEVRNSADHYDQAIGFCFEALGAGRLTVLFSQRAQRDGRLDFTRQPSLLSKDALLAEIVKWAQKKKARSVNEVLGAQIVIPQKMMAVLDEYHDARELLREEETLQALAETSTDDSESIQKDLQDLRQRMRDHKGLSSIMSMRNGEAITYEELLSLSKVLGPDVVIADFVHVESSCTGRDEDIWVMIFCDGSLIEIDGVDVLNAAAIKGWSGKYMDTDTPFSKTDASAELNLLFPLISCIVEHSKPGDTILFSVTTSLAGIPLHAIEIDSEPLIARNKVVYTQSLSVFRLCLLSAQMLITEPIDMIAVQALGDADSAKYDSASMRFASGLGAMLLKGPELNKESFLQAIPKALLIHFYGHVTFNSKEPLRSCLEIRDLAEERVTVQDLFNIQLRSGTHVSLIGCQSGETWKGSNDDSLGLTTAFFYGGAASVLSSQWKIKMRDGNEFQEAFYSELLKQSSQNFHDLADALQKAVLRLRIGPDGEVRLPYHWAGFILQGCWDRFPSLSGYLGSNH